MGVMRKTEEDTQNRRETVPVCLTVLIKCDISSPLRGYQPAGWAQMPPWLLSLSSLSFHPLAPGPWPFLFASHSSLVLFGSWLTPSLVKATDVLLLQK